LAGGWEDDVIWIFLLAGTLWATPEHEYAKDLARARTAATVERLQAEYSRFKIADTACRLELREHAAPVSCYEAITLERPANKASAGSARLKHLDKLCAKAAGALSLRDTSTFVSASCAKSLASAREIQDYRADEGADWSTY
jgi:hypothetical protein